MGGGAGGGGGGGGGGGVFLHSQCCAPATRAPILHHRAIGVTRRLNAAELSGCRSLSGATLALHVRYVFAVHCGPR